MAEMIITAVIVFGLWLSSKFVDKVAADTALSKMAPAITNWIPAANKAADSFGLPWQIILAIIWQESGGDPDAIGDAGEVGLMQVKPTQAIADIEQYGYGPYDYDTDPWENIFSGAAYLHLNMRSGRADGNIPLALRMYNQGPTGAFSQQKVPGGTMTKEQAGKKYAAEVIEKAKLIGWNG